MSDFFEESAFGDASASTFAQKLRHIIRSLLRPILLIPGAYVVLDPWLTLLVSGSSPRISTVRGNSFRLDPVDYTQRRAWFGVFETRELKFLRRELPLDGIAIDVGANIGLLTLPMAKCVGSKGQVLAVEAHPITVSALKRNLERNGIDWVDVRSCAVGSPSRVVRLGMPESRLGKSTGFYSIHATEGPDSLDVHVQPMEEIMNKWSCELSRVDVLKIDVEGMEMEVLVSLGKFLDPTLIKYILIEVSLDRRGLSSTSFAVTKHLVDRGFGLATLRFDGSLKRLEKDAQFRSPLPTVVNVVVLGNR